MKKMISLLLVLLMLLSTMVGCGSQGVEATNTEDADVSAEANNDSQGSNEEDPLKFGMIVWSKDDALGSMIYSTVNYAAEQLGVEMQWEIGWSDVDLQVTQAQNLIAAGVDGIMMVSITDGATEKVTELCEKAGIPFVLVHRRISDPDIAAIVEARDCYLGSLSEDYVVDATLVMEYMGSLGTIESVGLGLTTVGSALEIKNKGFLDGVEKYGYEVVGEFYADGAADTKTYAENLITTYPDMDCLIMTCGADGAAEAAYNRIKAVVGAGNIKLAMSDLPSDPLPMFEDGTLLCCTTGIYPLNMYALMMLYNEVTGNPVSETPVYLTQPSLLYTCAEDITELNKYVTNPDFHLWSAEEVKALVKAENPEVSEAFYQEKMNEWSADWVKSKIG